MASAAAADMSDQLHTALQAVSQRLQWTYSLLWHLCPDRRVLVWAEGHYNGAIKTRKTVQSTLDDEPSTTSDRSRQLQELFESLAGGGGGEVLRRPSAALAPEDLTETEWFYLMSASYSFPSGVGLPGKTFARKGHVWLSKANGVDSKTFSRAILARSAGIQTVVCIPIVDGVLEIGTTEKVEEDIGLIQYAVRIFIDSQDIHMMPSISEHSTSNQIPHTDQHSFQTQRKMDTSGQANKFSPEFGNNETEHGEDDEIDAVAECASGSETNHGRYYWQHEPLNFVSPDQATQSAGASALMQLEVSERVRDGCSSNLDDDIQMLMDGRNINDMSSLREQDHSWHSLYEDLMFSSHHQSAAGEDESMNQPENAHYSKTVMSILHSNARRQAETSIRSYYLSVSQNSSFCRWDPTMQKCMMISQATSSRMLKSVLFFSDVVAGGGQLPDPANGGAAGMRRSEGDLGANHVLKERRRREKLSERFIILRSLVPFVTKMDKASILGDTIEYVKQLRKRIQELESSAASSRSRGLMVHGDLQQVKKKKKSRTKLMAMEGSSTGSSSSSAPVVVQDVQVSIIESDALVEVRCSYRSGLLMEIMQAVQRELELDITAVEASSDGGVLVAEIRAKVNGRKSSSSISQVKREINMIISAAVGSM